MLVPEFSQKRNLKTNKSQHHKADVRTLKNNKRKRGDPSLKIATQANFPAKKKLRIITIAGTGPTLLQTKRKNLSANLSQTRLTVGKRKLLNQNPKNWNLKRDGTHNRVPLKTARALTLQNYPKRMIVREISRLEKRKAQIKASELNTNS